MSQAIEIAAQNDSLFAPWRIPGAPLPGFSIPSLEMLKFSMSRFPP
jgi:hypothetical protein